MPAPGVLAGLIEGAPEGRADESVRDQESKRPKDEESKRLRAERRETARGVAEGKPKGEERGNAAAGTRDVGTGGTVRTLPIRTPKRIASWMPRRVRQQVAAEQRAAAESGKLRPETGEEDKEAGDRRQVAGVGEEYTANGSRLHDPSAGQAGVTSGRPRQVAVPYRNYRRYRGA
jgi:hypothetical protein